MFGAIWLTATFCVSLTQSNPENQSRSVPPITGHSAPLPGVKAMEYPTANHSRLTMAQVATTQTMTLSTLLRCTMPP